MARTSTPSSTGRGRSKRPAKPRKAVPATGAPRSGSAAGPGRDLQAQEKRELKAAREHTRPGRFYQPYTDIYEADDRLVVVMDVPGVEKDRVDVRLEDDTLHVEGRIDLGKYEDLRPVYTEYNVGHFARSFTLSEQVEREGITASLNDGVLTLELPKVAAARRRRIPID